MKGIFFAPGQRKGGGWGMREYLIHARGIYDSETERLTAADGLRVAEAIVQKYL